MNATKTRLRHRDDAYLAFFADPALRDGLDDLARRNDRSRSAELRLLSPTT